MTGIYKYKKVFGSLPVNGDDPTIDTDFKVGLEGNTPTQTEKILRREQRFSSDH